MAAAETSPTPATIKAAAERRPVLDGFDRSRSRYAGEAALLAKGKEFAGRGGIERCPYRGIGRGDASVRRRSVGSGLSSARRCIETADRFRPRPADSGATRFARYREPGARDLEESRSRLAKLAPLLAAMQAGQTAENAQRLVAATAAITPFDEEVATPEQKDALAKARGCQNACLVPAAGPGERPDAARNSGDRPGRRRHLSDGEGPARRRIDGAAARLARQRRAAADAVAASDDRLDELVAAADKWRQRNGTADRGDLAALQAITPFDQTRFQDHHRAAWDTLSRAEAIILGPNSA